MTLIATAISNLGIVQGSDSNLTSADDEHAGEARKVFRVESVGAALGLAGTYSVGGVSMAEWMPATIEAYGAMRAPTLSGFAEFLRDRLVRDIDDGERARGSLIHVAGYVEVDGQAHPEFWFVRNVGMDNMTGEYVPQDRFDISEDFWSRDRLNPQVQQALEEGLEQRYFNGFVPGRQAYLDFMLSSNLFLQRAWNQASWGFRAPRNVTQLGRFVELEIQAIGAMFSSSDYAAPYIGGAVQIETLTPPANALRLGKGPTSGYY